MLNYDLNQKSSPTQFGVEHVRQYQRESSEGKKTKILIVSVFITCTEEEEKNFIRVTWYREKVWLMAYNHGKCSIKVI